jgi:hypothetical protein
MPALSEAFNPSDRRRIERDNALALYPSVAARLTRERARGRA